MDAPRSIMVFSAMVCKVRRIGHRLVVEHDHGELQQLGILLVVLFGLLVDGAIVAQLHREAGLPWTHEHVLRAGASVVVALLIACGAILVARALLRARRITTLVDVDLRTGWLSLPCGLVAPTASVVPELVEWATPMRANYRRVFMWQLQLRLHDRTMVLMTALAQADRPPASLSQCARRLAEHGFAPPWLLRCETPPRPLG
ncbi:MAG: hypothetical protein IAG13_37560 [Deltaproteobacteria bacterium]|nr:hypothetical protein [Nannocystaceae bacterium]